MAGIFGFFDYTKPGKGVEKDAPEKHPFFLFFELLWRKKGQLCLTNMIFFVFVLPILTLAYALFTSWLYSMGSEEMSIRVAWVVTALSLPSWLQIGLLAVSVFFYGPASCGMAYMLRNFVRQEKAWNTDFFSKLKQNFKQGLALGLLDLLVLCLLIFNLSFQSEDGLGGLFTLIRYLSVFFLLIYLFMRNYFYVLTVTFHLKVSQIIKNSFIFAIVGLWRNLLVLAVNGALLVLVVFFAPELVELALLPFLLLSLMGFVSMFTCYPVVKKHLIDPQNAATTQPDATTTPTLNS